MSGSNSGLGGYKPPANLLGDFTLKLDTQFLPSQMGWMAATRTGRVMPLGLDWPGRSEDPLRNLLGSIALDCAATPQVNPLILAVPRFKAADTKIWDTLYGILREAGPELWTDVNGRGRNIATGEPVTIGKLDPSGLFRPTAPDGVIAGTGLNSSMIPGGTLSLGKRFLFINSPDVHLSLYVDKDAAAKRPDLMLSGGGIGIEGKTSGGLDVKIKLGAGRDQAGGGAGFLKIQIGPDALPMSSQPGAPPPLF